MFQKFINEMRENSTKSKVVTTTVAIVLAILVIVIYNYIESPGYVYRRDMKNAESFYQKGEYEKAANVYLGILESKDDEAAKSGLVKAYIALAKESYENGNEDKAREFLLGAKVFDAENAEIKECFDSWFPQNPYEMPVRNLMEGFFEGDSKKMFSAYYPEILSTYVQAYEDAGLTEADFYANMDSRMEVKAGYYYVIEKAEVLPYIDLVNYEEQLYDSFGIEAQVMGGYLLTVMVCSDEKTEVNYLPVYLINDCWYASHIF